METLSRSDRTSAMISFRILGPFEVMDGDRPLPVGSPKERALLCLLVLDAGRLIGVDRLIDGLWGERAPATAVGTIRTYVSHLRRALGETEDVTLIETGGAGYRLRVEPDQIDAYRFSQLVEAGSHAFREGAYQETSDLLTEALTMWRGPPLVELADIDRARIEAQRLEQLRLHAIEERIAADLELGRHSTVIPELEMLTTEHPLRERPAALLMTALYRSGRQADALRVYQSIRHVLGEELGIEPGSELQRLEEAILLHDPALTPASGAVGRNLPLPMTSFVGRTEELKTIRQLLTTVRLLTLTGPGGSGKTRLALEAATGLIDHYQHGVTWVDLGPLDDPGLVPAQVASALGLQQTAVDPDARVREYLETKHMLLVLDGSERVSEAAPHVAGWLQAAPHLGVLVTSRVLLRIYGENEFPVPPLELPSLDHALSPDSLAEKDAVALFVERAKSAAPEFKLTDESAGTIGEIVNRLDGLPLAIELAAARVRVLTPQALLDRLSSRLDLLVGASRDVPARHQTLRKAIDWSYELLPNPVRRLFARVSVFQGGAQLDAIEQVCGPAENFGVDVLDTLDLLVDHSLVMRIPGEEQPRFVMLDTIREYATERLAESGETDELRRRHAHYYTGLAVEAKPHLTRAEVRTWLDRLDAELNNLRAAFSWTLEQGDAETAQKLVGSLWRFWQMRGHVAEGRELANDALGLDGATPRTRIEALEGAGGLAYWQADADAISDYYEEALALAEKTADPSLIASALCNLGYSYIPGDTKVAEKRIDLFAKSLEMARNVGDPEILANTSFALGNGYWFDGRPKESLPRYSESLDAAQQAGNRYIQGWSHRMRGLARLELGDREGARQDFTVGLQIFAAAGDISALALHIRDFAALAVLEGDDERALRLAGAVTQMETVSETRLTEVFENEVPGLGTVRARAGEEHAQMLIAEGRAMSGDEAVAYALQVDSPQGIDLSS